MFGLSCGCLVGDLLVRIPGGISTEIHFVAPHSNYVTVHAFFVWYLRMVVYGLHSYLVQ